MKKLNLGLWLLKKKNKYIYIGPVGRVFANEMGDWGSIPGQVKPKTQKNGTWCLTLHYNACIKGKVEQFKERSSAITDTSV